VTVDPARSPGPLDLPGVIARAKAKGVGVILYVNHLDQARLQLSREPGVLPHMVLNPEIRKLDDFTYEDFSLEGYVAQPHIKARVAV